MTDPISLLAPLFAWIGANPLEGIGAALAIPWVIVVFVLLLRRVFASPALPEPERAPEIEAPQPAPVAIAKPEPRREPEPVAVRAEPAPAPKPAPPVVEIAPPPVVIAPKPEVAPAPEPEPVAVRIEPAPAPKPEPAKPKVRLFDRLARTRSAFLGKLGALVGVRKVDGDVLEELEALLFSADLGVKTAESLLESVRARASGGDANQLRAVLRDAMLEKLRRVDVPAKVADTKPHVVLVLGVNGSGKTTTIGKLAARYQAAGQRVVMGAGDTFRAAAIEQLEVWGQRVGCEVVKGQAGGDPAAVAFDTVKAALARGCDVAIIDTAGRLQTKAPLIEELRKIVRVIGRDVPGAPHEVLLVLDANTGQNAISQARIFTEAAGVTGLVLTKLDGTAKGGVLVGLADEFGIPVRYVGVGETADDLRDFDAEEFVDALFEAEGGTA
jgi:fused signal recognition particle receptor